MVTITVNSREAKYLQFEFPVISSEAKWKKPSLHSNRIITTLHSQVSSSNQTATNILHLHRPDQALHSAPSTYMLHPSKAISVSRHYKRTETCTVENHSPFPTLSIPTTGGCTPLLFFSHLKNTKGESIDRDLDAYSVHCHIIIHPTIRALLLFPLILVVNYLWVWIPWTQSQTHQSQMVLRSAPK